MFTAFSIGDMAVTTADEIFGAHILVVRIVASLEVLPGSGFPDVQSLCPAR